MRDTIIYLVFGAVIVGAFIIKQLEVTAAQAEAAQWKAEAARAGAEMGQLRENIAMWKAANDRANTATQALMVQAQACLDRETAARADAERWQDILTNMTLRPMSGAEAQGVPDDATRRALCADLDRPL